MQDSNRGDLTYFNRLILGPKHYYKCSLSSQKSFNQIKLVKRSLSVDSSNSLTNSASGIKTQRKSLVSPIQNEKINKKVVNLEIHVGNYCNLKCVICRNEWSSAWRKDAEAMGLKTYDNFKLDPDSLHVDWKSVEWLHFNGGEPLFTDDGLLY